MHGASFFDSLVETITAHTELSVLQDLVAEMRGTFAPDAIAFVERKVSTALQREEAADAAFPGVVDGAVWDWQRATRLTRSLELVH